MTVVWQAAARADVIRLVRYIAEENPIAARKVARVLILAGDSFAVFPRPITRTGMPVTGTPSSQRLLCGNIRLCVLRIKGDAHD